MCLQGQAAWEHAEKADCSHRHRWLRSLIDRGLRVGIAGKASQPSNCDSISSVHVREASPVLRPKATTIPLLREILQCAENRSLQ